MSGVDIANQFPNSAMARAVKLGQSRFMSVDGPTIPAGASQINTSITNGAGTALTLPSVAGTNNLPPTYAVITAIGGPLYATYDGSVPSAANYDVTVAAGSQLPVQGSKALAGIRVFGTTMSVSYWS